MAEETSQHGDGASSLQSGARASSGRLRGQKGLTLTALVPGARRGDWVRIEKRDGSLLDAEVIAFDAELVTLMPLGDVRGIGVDDPIRWLGNSFAVAMSESWLGRVVD